MSYLILALLWEMFSTMAVRLQGDLCSRPHCILTIHARSGRENEIIGKLVTWESLHVYRNPNVASYHPLGTYTSKDYSAWTEVWTDTWSPTTSITAPQGRDLGDFKVSGNPGDM